MPNLLLIAPLLVDCLLCAAFGGSLLPGRTPLLTVLARQAHGHELDAKTSAYTRRLTTVWALCPAALAALIIAGLLNSALTPLAIGVALAQGPLFFILLVGEHFVRRRHLDHLQHMRFVDFLRFLRRVDYRAALRD